MAAERDNQFTVLRDFRPAIVALCGEPRERGQHVEFGERLGRLADAPRLGGDLAANLREQRALKSLDALLGVEDFDLEFLQFRRREALRVHQRLLALVISRGEVEVGFGDFNVITEHVIKANFE